MKLQEELKDMGMEEYLEGEVAEEKSLTVVKSQVGKIQNPIITSNQIIALLARTPEKYKYTRPAKGGGDWTYVSGGYVKKTLNRIFGWAWSFEIKDKWKEDGEVVVLGKLLIVNGKGEVFLAKEDFGKKEIVCKRGTDKPLSIGNDYKSAATDCLKRCAYQLGLASDVYAPEEFNQLKNIENSILNEENVKAESTDLLENTKTLKELMEVWANFPAHIKSELRSLKNELKQKYENT
jgi:hypothetical protein